MTDPTVDALADALHRDPAVCNNKPHAKWKILSRCDHIAAALAALEAAAEREVKP